MLLYKVWSRLRGVYLSLTTRLSIKKAGRKNLFLGVKYIRCLKLSVGDNCWIQAIDNYKKQKFKPIMCFGEQVMMSNNVHISAVHKILIGSNTLLGSNIYIGDHSHGSTDPDKFDPTIPPALRPLDDIGEIEIGKNVWICDNVIILAGTFIGNGSIVAANSVVKGYFEENCLIAGSPAKIIRKLK